LWRETVNLVRCDFPAVPVIHRLVDAAAMDLVIHPDRFQVVVTENLFGDILSDLTGGLVGSLGLLGSSSVAGQPGTRGLFEPVHGSAPDIAGRGIANPVGALLSLAALMRWSWQDDTSADAVEAAVKETLRSGVRTPDIGGSDSTESMTQAVVKHLET
jgi:3-isopropylmalate dehydrogenase